MKLDFNFIPYYTYEIEISKTIVIKGGNNMDIINRTILYKVAEEFDLTREGTEERLKLQKTIYLLQSYGLKLGYGFSWYKYGPYSQDLVFDAYAVLESEKSKFEQESQKLSFSQSCQQKFAEFRRICGYVLDSAELLELVASVCFLCETWYPSAGRLQIAPLLKKHKKQYFNGQLIPDDKIIQAFDICTKLRHS
jgi:uncharacterized protein YwgA